MALTIASATTSHFTDPTLSLKSALAAFEDILDHDQKNQYRASSTNLDTSAVISFIRIIDETSLNKARRGVSSRLYTFLNALQQFTGIIDTLVSSNPLIAALVWGGVKTTILAASNVSSYFDKVTNLIMTIGKSCPTYQSFGLLYPGCIELQHALCEYYATIIRLCTKIVVVSQRSFASQALNSFITPFEAEFSDLVVSLNQAVKHVKLQCTFASNKATVEQEQLAAVERKENEKYRHLGKIFRSDITKQQTETREWQIRQTQRDVLRLKDKVRQRLSTIEPLRALKRMLIQRVPKTAEWFRHDPDFLAWRSDKNSGTLWCVGTMGTGKTVLISSIVEYLHMTREPTDIISHHFCLADHAITLQAREILGSIARQLLDPWIQKSKADELRTFFQTISETDSTEIIDILSARMDGSNLHLIVLDGFDECETEDIEELVKCLAALIQKHPYNLKLVIASRPDTVKKLRRSLDVSHRMSLSKSKTQSDMRSYIQITLDQCLEDGKLSLTNPQLILHISATLEKDAHGMFLWVHLFINDICEQNNDDSITVLLDSPSPSISNLIDRKIDRIQHDAYAKDIIKLLQYCAVAKRALNTYEYRELLGLETNQQFLNSGTLIHDVDRVAARTGGLLHIDEEEETVHYVHHSIKTYLFRSSGESCSVFDETKLDLQLGYLSLTYLNFNDFRRTLAKVDSGSTTSIRPIDISLLALSSSNKVAARWAQKLLRNQHNSQSVSGKDLKRMTQDIIGTSGTLSNRLEDQYRFLQYAKTYWLDHLGHITQSNDARMWNMFHNYVSGENELVTTPWNHEISPSKLTFEQHLQKSTGKDLILEWALDHEKSALLNHQIMYQRQAMSNENQIRIIMQCDIIYLFPLMQILTLPELYSNEILHTGAVRAAEEGSIACVDLYIQLVSPKGLQNHREHGRTLLEAAASGGRLDIVERLLAAKAEINATAVPVGLTALQAAARVGHLDVVDRLLVAKADSNITHDQGLTALHYAVARGHIEVVEVLLAAGADANATHRKGRTALHDASENGFLEAVEKLLDAKADLDIVDMDGRTALHYASIYGHLDVVERLLEVKADMNISDEDGLTALHRASSRDHLDIVQRLLKANANANVVNKYGQTALHYASMNGNLDVVGGLLEAKVDADVVDIYGETALHRASSRGHLDIVQRLLRANANMDIVDKNGQTALHGACLKRQYGVIRILLEEKADVNITDNRRQTALHLASEHGFSNVVEQLLDANADVNIVNTDGRTALLYASICGHPKIVGRLLDAKADVNIVDFEDKTALDHANIGNHMEIVKMLKRAGARK